MDLSAVARPDPAVLAGVDKVLVTGATGFIGRHLARRLAALGKSVVAVSRRDGIDIAKDPLPLAGVGYVFHAAGLTGVPGSWHDPTAYVDVNAGGTARVLEQCRRQGCPVTFLSAYVYGRPDRLPTGEADAVDPNNPYALSKLLAEQVCTFYAKHYGLPIVILRLFNVYGPGQDEGFLLPLIVRQLLDPQCRCVEVADLAPRRDYVNIADVVDAVLLSAGAASGSVFNVCSGETFSVDDVVALAARAAGVDKARRATGNSRSNEIAVTLGNNSAIRTALGWQPRVSFERGVADVVEAMRR